MKKFTTLLLVVLLAISFAGCKKPPVVVTESDEYVVINVQGATDNQTLAGYMASLSEYSDIFTIDNGMVTSINGISNAPDWSACWMLYTNDTEVSDTAYSIEYKGKIYGSALYGAETLVVKNGKTYIWVYVTL